MPIKRIKIKKTDNQDFLGSPLVKILLSSVQSTGSIPGWGAKISHAS